MLLHHEQFFHHSAIIFYPSSLPQLHAFPVYHYYPTIRILSHLSSFSLSVFPIWNCLPSDSSSHVFKRSLKLLPVNS